MKLFFSFLLKLNLYLLLTRSTTMCDNKCSDTIEICKMYDIIYGIIEISTIAKKITEHPLFQRMKNIRQLGPLRFVFNYADHDRFSHSIGVAYLSRYVGNTLKAKDPNITDRMILCLEIAGLCHDLGHGPFSHSFDNLIDNQGTKSKYAKHEERSKKLTELIIKSIPSLGISDDEIHIIQHFINPEEIKVEFPEGLDQIVSNNIHKFDVDKMDYLVRDAHMLRLNMVIDTKCNVLNMLQNTEIVDDPVTKKKCWMFHIKDSVTVYDLICRRFIHYNNFYLHPRVNSINCMLIDALSILNNLSPITECIELDSIDNAEKFAKLTDDYIIELLLNIKDTKYAQAKKLIENIINGEEIYDPYGDTTYPSSNSDKMISHAELTQNICKDDSAPTILLPKVKYYKDGKIIVHESTENKKRIYKK